MQKVIRNKGVIYLPSIALFACCMALTGYLYHLEKQSQLAKLRDQVVSQAGTIRANIEHEVNTSLNLTMGLVVYIVSNPEITQLEFEPIAERIIGKASYIQNIGLAKDNVISHIYPLEGNAQALGLRYMDIPQQRDAVIRAIESRNTIIAGPVNLVQGGVGLISRIPIFLDKQQQRYWGIASLVIKADEFFARLGIESFSGTLNIGLRGKDSRGDAGEVFYGDPGLFSQGQSVVLPISLPEGSWILVAAPKAGWHMDGQRAFSIWLIGTSVSLLLSVLFFALLKTISALSEAKRKMGLAYAHKERFFTHMAHELRTPLTAIQGVVGLLASKKVALDTEKADGLLQNAQRNCQRLLWIINDVLDLKKLESASRKDVMVPLSISKVIENAIDEVGQVAGQYQMAIIREGGNDNAIEVLGDASQLRQVLVNLLANAIKYSPSGSSITVKLDARVGDVRVEVIDQGEGISPDKIDDVFNEFSQDKASEKIGIASTGLGLAISKLIIGQHEGSIGCYNVTDGGCCFFFVLPRYEG
jgi:signal transduction histidine kinase